MPCPSRSASNVNSKNVSVTIQIIAGLELYMKTEPADCRYGGVVRQSHGTSHQTCALVREAMALAAAKSAAQCVEQRTPIYTARAHEPDLSSTKGARCPGQFYPFPHRYQPFVMDLHCVHQIYAVGVVTRYAERDCRHGAPRDGGRGPRGEGAGPRQGPNIETQKPLRRQPGHRHPPPTRAHSAHRSALPHGLASRQDSSPIPDPA